MSSAAPATIPPPRKRWTQFSLRSLLLVATLVAVLLGLWAQQRQIGRLKWVIEESRLPLEPLNLASDQFHVDVEDLVRGSGQTVTKHIVVRTMGDAQTTVTDQQGNLSSLANQQTLGSDHGSTSCDITIAADLIDQRDPKQNLLRQMIQLSTPNGSYVGGPGTLPAPNKSRLDEVFQMHLKPGFYLRSTPIDFCTFNGRKFVLIVR